MYGQFLRETTHIIDKDKNWNWLTRSDLKVETEALICAAQEQAIRTNYIKHKIDLRPLIALCVGCAVKEAKVCSTLSVNVKSWLRKKTNGEMTALAKTWYRSRFSSTLARFNFFAVGNFETFIKPFPKPFSFAFQKSKQN